MTKTLGRYEIVKHLANGGMAQVLLARATGIENFERHVVIKRIRGEQAKDESFVKMFLDEARLAAALHHQHIVQTHDVGQEGGEYFFAMEYVHGEDCRKILGDLSKKKQQLPLEHLITIAIGALAGLHHAHEHPLKIVHRDVSPSNILVGFDGGVKMADFGIAKAALRSHETRSGTLKGKVSYMSPEQCTGRAVDRRSDIFAFGVVLYELSTVRRLFKAANDFMTMTTIVQGSIPPPTSVRPDLPKPLEDIIMKALSMTPDKRFATADEMRQALEQFASDAGLRTSNTSLARFMKAQFGDRPEPWLETEEATEVSELTVDFDGSESGVAKSSEGLLEVLDIRDSAPIMTAKSSGAHAALAATGGRASAKDPTTASGTPIAWMREPSVLIGIASRRRWMIAGIAGVALAAITLMIVVSSGGDDSIDSDPTPTASEPTKPPATPPVATPRPPVAVPADAAVEVEIDAAVETKPEDSIATSAGSGSAAPKPKRPRRPTAKPGSTPKWDPTKLFPNQK